MKKYKMQGLAAGSGIFTAAALRKISMISCLLKLIPVLLGIITADLMSKIVEQASGGQTHAVIRTGFTLLGMVAAIKIFQILTGIAYQKAESGVLHSCKMELYHRFLSNPLSHLYASEMGAAKEKLNDDFDTVMQKHVSLYPNFLVGMITTITYFVFLARQNLLVAGILTGMSLLQMIPPIIINKFLQVNYDSCREIEAKLSDFTVSAYRGFQVIKLYELKQWWLGKLKEYHKKYTRIGNASIYAGTAENTLKDFIATLIKYGTYAILGLLIMAGRADMDVAVEAIALSTGFFAAMRGIFSAIPKFGVAKVAEKRLAEWLVPYRQTSMRLEMEGSLHKASTEVDEKEALQDVSAGFDRKVTLQNAVCNFNAKIILQNVSHNFGDKVILQNVSAVLDANKLCLIKGENGIGKSTLFRLLTGLLVCEQGEIKVGGTEPGKFTDRFFPGRLFYLPQTDVEFEFTPFELYKMVDEKRLPEVRHVAKQFSLLDKHILDTKISDLSGGERKKVYLALAFALNPDFLFLDEPTNSLDQESKQVLVRLLKERTGGALIITHDPILDEAAECVIRIAEGGITVEEASYL